MKYKYLVSLSEDKKELRIKEYGELDKEFFSLLGEETYDSKPLKSNILEKNLEHPPQIIATICFLCKNEMS